MEKGKKSKRNGERWGTRNCCEPSQWQHARYGPVVGADGVDDDVLRIFIGETSEFGFCQFGDHGWLRGNDSARPVNIHDRKDGHRMYTCTHKTCYTRHNNNGEIVPWTGGGRVAPRIIIIFVISWHSTRRAHQSENRINQLSHSRPNSKQEKGGERVEGGGGGGGEGWWSSTARIPVPREIPFNPPWNPV